ncbi:Annexin D5 [Thelohanellus kitauei]|uniref:Annexin D5 n=1 Tax=Thelohanellus kitauei TaxID=669202 RepID=A0A0C2J4Y6_THEKT|nr:Annexin D5 [Thelohanellus kitauei]
MLRTDATPALPFDLIPYTKTYEYFNPFDEDQSVHLSQPNLLVHGQYNLENDIETIQKGDFWTYVCVCIRRPAKYREMLSAKLLRDHGTIWLHLMKKFMSTQSSKNEIYRFTFNAFKLSGAALDAYFLYIILNPKKRFFGEQPIHINELLEILCTRSYEQIVEIKKNFQKVYGHDLSDSICNKLKGSSKTFFYNVLNMRRYSRPDSYDVDIRFFVDVMYYRKNKDKFVEIFSRRSFSDIRKICLNFEEVYGRDIRCQLYVFVKSILQKCALAVCNYCLSKNFYFSINLKKYIKKKNINGIIRLILTRSEVDFGSIIREYAFRNNIMPLDAIRPLFNHHKELFERFMTPMLSIENY